METMLELVLKESIEIGGWLVRPIIRDRDEDGESGRDVSQCPDSI